MTVVKNKISFRDRPALLDQAMRAASRVRQLIGTDQHSPLCIYEACKALGVSVRFNDIDMEGMYQKSGKPQIHLSAKRPLVRRNYNCAHELGHHVFEHGSSIDQLSDRAGLNSRDNPEELLADTFAAHLLIPTIGLRGAFNRRNITPDSVTPLQMYTIACDFGVGYTTLITHMATGLRMISHEKAKELKRRTPKDIRYETLGGIASHSLVIAGPNRNYTKIDAEVGTHILLPKGTVVETGNVIPLGHVKNGNLFLATEPGISNLVSKNWSAEIRISRHAFVGLAQFRHLEEAA